LEVRPRPSGGLASALQAELSQDRRHV